MTPIYQLILEGRPLELRGRLISLSLIDKNGMEVDELTVEIDDSDGMVELPSKGKKLTAVFGFAGREQNRGTYIVDEIGHHGPPDVITIRARSADFRKTLLEEREKSYHKTTVGAVIAEIAARHGLTPAVSAELAGIAVEHLDQTNESDAHLVTRLAQEHDAVGTVKDGRLLFTVRAAGKTSSGQDLPTVTIHRSEGDSHDFTDADRDDRVTGVVAYWHDKKSAKRKKAEVGADGYRRHLKQTYNSEKEAKAAEAEMKRIKTRARTLSLNLAFGRAELFAEQPLKVEGFKPQIDAVRWFIKEITHTLGDNGYTVQISCAEMEG
jgi:phage late control protein D protein (GPD)